MRRLASVFSSFALLALLASPVVAAAPIAVDCTNDQAAMRTAVATVPPHSTLVMTGTCVGMLDIDRDLTIKPGSASARLTSDVFPSGVASVAHVHAGASVVFKGLSVRGANHGPGLIQLLNDGSLTLADSIVTDGSLEAIRNFGTLTLRGSAVTDNWSKGSAPILNLGGTVTLIRSVVSGNNNTELTGAIANDQAGTVTLIDSTLRDNFGYTNLVNNLGTMSFRSSTVSGNEAFFATLVNRGSMSFTSSTVSDNQGGTPGLTGPGGGGIYNADTGALLLRDSTVRANVSFGDGGGIYNGGVADLRDSRVISNTAAGDGGGIFNVGSITLRDTTISGNAPNDCVGC